MNKLEYYATIHRYLDLDEKIEGTNTPKFVVLDDGRVMKQTYLGQELTQTYIGNTELPNDPLYDFTV